MHLLFVVDAVMFMFSTSFVWSLFGVCCLRLAAGSWLFRFSFISQVVADCWLAVQVLILFRDAAIHGALYSYLNTL